ncbi:MAG: hypothetical protein KDD67_02905 [Ignavibacteriae bacterium]|nr:hypothetical protein [Ignavibacteriota bacterium]MCB9216991.1 hypothetical protein [Ignavibacteria bacterium]
MDLYKILVEAHSGMRWLVLLMFIVTMVKLLVTWLGKKEFGKGDNALLRATIGFIDIQLLLGLSLLLYFILNAGGLASYHYEHAGINAIAIIFAHIAGKGKDKPGPIRARNAFIFLFVSAALVGLAISRLPQGW